MDDNISKYELLILKEFEGKISEDEINELNEWIQSPQNNLSYQEQKKLWRSLEDFRKMQKIDKKKALKKVESRLFSRFSTKIIQYLEKVAAILFIPLLLSTMWFYFSQNSTSEILYNTVEIPLGMRSSMVLPDGTSVWLNAGSSLKYPVPFEAGSRQVNLTGEAYFEVKKDKTKPFIVSASGVKIKVLGTSFNCCAYAGENRVETALIEGKIEISGEAGENKLLMNPGELAVFTKAGNTMSIESANLDKNIAWKSGKLLFRDDPMNKVLEKLGRWYNVDFRVEDEEILGYVYSATFTGESLDQMLKMLALSAPIDYRILSRKKLDDKSYEKQVIELKKKQIMGE